MPPKPFNPPRPNKSTSSKISKSKSTTPKPRGRPKGSTSATKSTSSSKPNKSASASAPSPSASDNNNDNSQSEREGEAEAEEEQDPESDDPFASSLPEKVPKARKKSDKSAQLEVDDGGRDGGEEEEVDDERAKIPDELLTKIIHEMFKEDRSRISKEANNAVGKYLDTFVREAVARVRFAGGRGREGGWWEVEDLEKIAPQLLLDF